MKTYVDIAKTGNYRLIQIKGMYNSKHCLEMWERIVKRSSEATKTLTYNTYINLISSLGLLMHEYHMVKLYLIKAYFKIDDEAIEYLRSCGFNIVTTGANAYKKSLDDAIRSSANYITRIQMAGKELNKQQSKPGVEYGFEEMIADTSYQIGFAIGKDITLAEYNEYQKIISKKHERNKKAADNSR